MSNLSPLSPTTVFAVIKNFFYAEMCPFGKSLLNRYSKGILFLVSRVRRTHRRRGTGRLATLENLGPRVKRSFFTCVGFFTTTCVIHVDDRSVCNAALAASRTCAEIRRYVVKFTDPVERHEAPRQPRRREEESEDENWRKDSRGSAYVIALRTVH